eukprot:375101_1
MIQPAMLNAYLKEFMSGLTAKVFRTYNASVCMEQQLYDDPVTEDVSLHDKMAYFTAANTQVAVLCNHQKSVSRLHDAMTNKMAGQLAQKKRLLARLEMLQDDIEEEDEKELRQRWFDEEYEMPTNWVKQYGKEEDRIKVEGEKGTWEKK